MRAYRVRYILGRIGQAALVLWAAYTVAYVILELLPANPLMMIAQAKGSDLSALNADQIAVLKRTYGLSDNPVQQYFSMLTGALHGDFGISYQLDQPVAQLIASRVSSTLLISLLAIALALVVSFLLAFAAAFTGNQTIRSVLNALPTFGVSVPYFWVGLLLMQVFCFWLGWLPSMGNDGWQSLILPTITMSIPTTALLSRLLMSGFDEVLQEPFVKVAVAHGLGRSRIILRHAIKNASLPVLTILGLIVGDTVTGAIVAETVFSRQGLGSLIQQSVSTQDIPVVLGTVVLAATAFVAVNLIVDLIYPLLDPRIGYSSKRIAS